ncbi:MAG: DUF1854 domain-containing protein [Lachnospiraceae bacterium]|nr:DUF1854 domain-containing protein [Lachnospiraceae bacterium]
MNENIININEVKFEKTAGGLVSMELAGTSYKRVKPIRLFPFTDPGKYIAIHDEQDAEIGVIEDLEQLSKDQAALLQEQLDLYYFTPVISKIINIKDEYGYAYFHVVTDRGECKFAINMGSNAVAKLSDNRLLITDLDGNRFEVADVQALTVKEQRKLDLFL